MSPEKVKELLGETPWMTLEQGKTMTSFIHHHGIKTILELGFEHGVSSCYMAAALEDKKDGMLVTIDTEDAKKREPSIEQLLELVGLTHKVTIYYEPRTYLWRLMKLLEHDPTPRFDLCYIDGSHQWVTDGFAFLLADRLLKPEGWVIFDDLDWTVAGSPVDKQTAWAVQLTDEERFTPQIRKVYELLVKSHPNYDHFRTEDGWAYASNSRSWLVRPIRAISERVWRVHLTNPSVDFAAPTHTKRGIQLGARQHLTEVEMQLRPDRRLSTLWIGASRWSERTNGQLGGVDIQDGSRFLQAVV